MEDSLLELNQWIEELKDYRAVRWDQMPDIDLYMDQVITFLERQLSSFRRDSDKKGITSSMINNYVKDSLVSRPRGKKYSQEHIAALYEICMLKSVLSIPDISRLLHSDSGGLNAQQLHDCFCEMQDAEFTRLSAQLKGSLSQLDVDSSEAELKLLVLQLSIEACARSLAAQKILSLFHEPDKKEKGKDKADADKNT